MRLPSNPVVLGDGEREVPPLAWPGKDKMSTFVRPGETALGLIIQRLADQREQDARADVCQPSAALQTGA